MMKLSPACDHGFPLRVIVPGYAAVRNVQWLSKIEISKSETEGAWQEGLNYKILPPSVTDANNVDLKKMPSMSEVAVFRGITNMEMAGRPKLKPGKTIMVKTNGWAWSGGGRNFVRVDITGDGGESSHGKQQRSKRAEIRNLDELGHGYFGSAKFQLLSRKMEL
jgi:sulfite oxidase